MFFQQNYDDGIDTQKEKRNGESKKKRRKPSIRIKTDTVDLWNRRFFMCCFDYCWMLRMQTDDFIGGLNFQWNR